MARQSSITELPEPVRDWLNKALTEQNFSGYEALETMMREKGFAISKSAIHRYGQKIERRFAAIKASTEAARMITEGAADDQDARSEAVIALCQTEIFDAMIAMQEASDEDLDPLERMGAISSVAKNVAALTGASIRQKQFKSVVQSRAAEAAEKVAKLAAKGGMSASTVAEIKRSILGIAA
ncbi:MAG: DUF3486 family protein [Dechloromonas sp.]|nr:DUF3486 family protein [Dechloromonas sp.]